MPYNKILAGLFGLVLATAYASPSLAQDTAKVAYVNLAEAIEKAPQGDAALKKLEGEFGPRDKKLKGLRSQIKKIEGELEKDALILKESDRLKKERKLQQLKREFKRERQVFREDYNLRRNEELGKLQKIVLKIVVQIAKEEKLDLVTYEGVVYASDRIDITKKVLEKLGAKGAKKK